jgi:nucleoside-diphosphate kinase
MQNERTFVMIKPDGVQRGFVGEIITRFEKKGLKIVAMKLVSVSKELVQRNIMVFIKVNLFLSQL